MSHTPQKIMPSRLACRYPEVQQALDAGLPGRNRQVATRIVLWAASEAGLNRAEIVIALAKKDPALFDALCAEMEEQQFRLFERGDERHLVFSTRHGSIAQAPGWPVTSPMKRSMSQYLRQTAHC